MGNTVEDGAEGSGVFEVWVQLGGDLAEACWRNLASGEFLTGFFEGGMSGVRAWVGRRLRIIRLKTWNGGG